MNLPEQIKSIFGKKNMQYGIGIILLGFLVWLSFKPKKVNAETAIIQRGTLIQFVEEEGISRVKEKFQIFSPVNGVLNRIEKNTGDKVKKGEVVALIDWDYKREVLSPISGKILIIHRESAGPIAMGNPIMDIGDISTQEIVVEILTQEAVKIQAGNPVSIEGWGGNPLEGKVRLVEPEAFKKISSLGVEEQRVKVLIDFITPENMGEGFKVLCKIQIQKEDNKVLAPSSSLFREGENWAVYKVVKGRIQKAIVKVETRSGNFVSITEGLQENEEIILFPSEGIKEGLKIRK
ncbi:MAG: efflux RND transporter periplasmic adaptor subunit [Leptospiraceae bacterium]|nr:efflux RND transporter periplasmic adaptor subunit [Leptospiraceae bacterium]